MAPESKDLGDISWRDYRNFFGYAYGCCGIVTLFLICLLTSISQLLPSLWMTEWLKQPLEEQQLSKYPIIFAILITAFIILTGLRSLYVYQITLKSTTKLHDAITKRVLRANILFFDSNPIGRIVTRFSKDVITFDLIVPILMIITIQGFFRTATVVITICIFNYWMLIVVLVAVILMYFVMKKGTKVMIESQRRDAESRTPIHGTIALVINGMVSLRAADRFRFFRQEFVNSLELGTNATFCYVIANRWIGIRADLICVVFITLVCFFLVYLKGEIESSLLVMSLQVASDVIFLFSISFRMYAEVENAMTSAQRMFAYTQLEQEDSLVKEAVDSELERRNWPSTGKIEYEEATMRYRRELEPSILNLSFKAQGGMFVGIVGRTGSGKSSILQTLFRLVELANGKTSIDGVDIKTVGLHILRKSIAYIPQSPFLI